MRKINIEIIILTILWFTTIYSIVENYYINIYFWIGIVGLIIATLCVRKFNVFTSYFLMLLLLFSIVKLVAFSSTTYSVGISGVSVNILSLILFSILIYKRQNMIREWISKDSEKALNQENTKVVIFKREFQKLTDKELEDKINNESLVSEAIVAIKELLNERKLK